MQGYERSHPDTDIVLFEPDDHDAQMFLANTFSYSQRRALAEHAYQQTRRLLRSRRDALNRRLGRHGVRIDDAVLGDPRRRLVAPAASTRPVPALARLDHVLDDLERALARQA